MNDVVPWAAESYALAAGCFALFAAEPLHAFPILAYGLLIIGIVAIFAPFTAALIHQRTHSSD